jgi:hypothetical protein
MIPVLFFAAAVAIFAWPYIQPHIPAIDLTKLDRRHLAGVALLAAAVAAYAIKPTEAEPQPAPPEPASFNLKGCFIGPDAATDAQLTAAICRELAEELEWDGSQPTPLIASGVAFDELRVRTRTLMCRGQSLGDKHPRARDAIERFLNEHAGTSGGPLAPEQRAQWVAAYRDVGRAAEDAAR